MFKMLRSLFCSRKIESKITYSFCESITATAISSWHIRKLSDKGQKLGGGADTLSLCGRNVCWDLNVEITEHHLTHCCRECEKIWRVEC